MSEGITDASQYPGLCTQTSLIQLAVGLWANLSTAAIGMAFAFPAIQVPQLTSANSEIKVTREEASWIASILSLFAPLGCLSSGILMDKFGRSTVLRWCTLPMVIGWIFTVAAETATKMIIARAVLGFGCGMAMGPSRLYTAEISLPNMRGLLGALPNIFLSLGMAIQASLGLIYPWPKLCYLSGVYNIVLFCSYLKLVETPYYLLLHDNTGKARNALSLFRGEGYDIEQEINTLIDFKHANNIRSLSCREKMKALTQRNAYKPFGIIMIYVTCECLAGTPIVTFWTIELLLALKSSSDVYESNLYIAFTRLVFCGVASILLFSTARKKMALISAGGVCLTCFALAFFIYMEQECTIYPQFFLMVYTAFSSLGFYILPFLFMSELYPLQIRGTLTGISISIVNIEKFLTTKCFIYVRDNFGMTTIILFFGLSALICFLFLYRYLPETKNLTLREIEEHFNDTHTTPATERQLSNVHTGTSRLGDVVSHFGGKKKDKQFIEIYDASASPSLVSRDSKKSVTLLIGGKQFRSTTSEERLQIELQDMHASQAELNQRGSLSRSEQPSSSRKSKDSHVNK